MHVSLVICLINLINAHGDDEDDASHDKAAEPTELPEAKPPIDNGQINAEIDLPIKCRTKDTWDNCEVWTCPEGGQWTVNHSQNNSFDDTTIKVDQKADFGGHKSDMIDQHQEELYPNSNYPNGIPASGYHRPKWPEYGEYRWIPPLRYVHALEHGAMLFMYHPCAPTETVQKLRSLARGCLWKHLIFAFRGDFTEDHPVALVSYGTILKVSEINDKNIVDLRKWVRKYSKAGANGEGRVYGNGTYNLLLEHQADIVTEIEDTEVCPGDNIIDTTLFTYQTSTTKEPEIQLTTEKPKTEPEPKTTKALETVETTKKTEELQENEDEKIPEDYVEPNEEQENEEVTDEIENVLTTTTKTDVTTTTMPSEMPETTITTHRLIVGTPPGTSKPTIDYSIDEQYDDYETNQNLFDSPEAQQEALVQIKRSESFWAFLSCTVLVVVLTLALYKSQLCRRTHKGYMRNNDHWTEDDQSISVGTLVRNMRKKNSIDETKYSLLRNEEDNL